MSNKQSSKSRRRQKKKEEAKAQEDTLKEQGNQSFAVKKYEQALSFYTRAIEAKEEPLFVIYSNRSATYTALERFDLALTDSQKVIELNTTWPKGYFRQGQALEGMKKVNEAKEAYELGLKLGKDPSEKDISLLTGALTSVNKLIEELSLSEIESRSNLNPQNDVFYKFLQWLDNGKVKYGNLFIKYYGEDYRGVHMRISVSKDTTILTVPLPMIMTSEVAKASEIGRAIIHTGIELVSTHSYLASFLLQERSKGTNSYWEPYIGTLPVEYNNMPIFFKPIELAYMRASFSLKKMHDQYAALKREYDNLCKVLPSFNNYSLRDFIWARTAVITRIFGITVNDNKTDGLVPMADMLNHKRPRETSWSYDNSKSAFTIVSLKSLDRGEQVFDSYGRKCNSRFFVNYGFSLEENEEDNECVFTLSLPIDDPHYTLKCRLFNAMGFGGPRKDFQMPTNYKDKKSRQLYTFARIIHAQEKEIVLLESRDDKKDEDIGAISIENERSALKTMSEAAEKRMQAFDTTLEEDIEMLTKLPKDTFTSNLRNALLMRKGEKEVLKYFIGLYPIVAPLLLKPWKELKHLVSGEKYTKYETYIQSVIVPLVKLNP